MIRSMTGYGRFEVEQDGRKFTAEIKSVNHRYNDISIRLPRSMNYLEDKIRKTLLKKITRGKTDVYINFESFSDDDVNIKINEALAKAYVEKLEFLKSEFGLQSPDMLALVAKFADVISVEKVQDDEDIIWQILLPTIEGALDNFVSMREAEGEALKEDILKKASLIESFVEQVKERTPQIVEEYRQKLMAKLEEFLGNIEIDEQRVLTEVMIYTDKVCVDEEITRLLSHIDQLREILKSEDAVGRKLDFLVQELNREANTIASKSNDISLTKISVELKSEIEKIREQIQNIE